jgi:MHS family proline/betaine transporter-like MFS transporter
MPPTNDDDFVTEQETPPHEPHRSLPFACTDGPATSLLPPEPTVMQTVAGVMGNVLEWYDFALFGFFSDVIAEVFFPPLANGGEVVVMQDDGIGFGGEISFEVDGEKDTRNLIRSFAVYGAGKGGCLD